MTVVIGPSTASARKSRGIDFWRAIDRFRAVRSSDAGRGRRRHDRVIAEIYVGVLPSSRPREKPDYGFEQEGTQSKPSRFRT